MIDQRDEDFMRLAISEASKSKGEAKTTPKVGAVLAREGHLVASAYRGQMAKGHHAEFTLLHKIVRSRDRTEGATLYTTLEPCTTRSHDKLPCAEWIVQKGIRRVVIGILDPNPIICGRGYWHLIENNIEVEFFPAELARRIRRQNREFIAHQRGEVEVGPTFGEIIQRNKSALISPYLAIGWKDTLSLQDCPNLREGWPVGQVEIREVDAELLAFPTEYELAYREYVRQYFDAKRFQVDNENFSVWRNPTAFSDNPYLLLEVVPTTYRKVKFYNDCIAPYAAKRDPMIREYIQGSLLASFHHTTTMHMVVVTSDDRLLLTKRSPKVNLFAKTWSASCEEQLSRKDFANNAGVGAAWAARTLSEELGIDESHYHLDNLRVLAVFLMASLMNVGLCVYAGLDIDSKTMSAFLSSAPKTDWEFTEWDFLDVDPEVLLQELLYPARAYHPTTPFRLVYMFLRRFGSPTEAQLKRVRERNHS